MRGTVSAAVAVKRKEVTEHEKNPLESKKQQLEIETEIAASEARLKVYEEFEDTQEFKDDYQTQEPEPDLYIWQV